MRVRRRVARVSRVAFLAAAALAVPLGVRATERVEVIIGGTRLTPPVATATTQRPVVFVNRSGEPVHLELIGRSDHYVFQVQGWMSAVFHRPGRHPYVVHFGNDRPSLMGTVEAHDDPAGPTSGPCTGVTVMEACIER